MKQNILVVSYDYFLSRAVAKKLAETFSMRTLDQRELFEFDHVPLGFAEVCKVQGFDYVKKELSSLINMELDFDGVVFVADMSFADNMQDVFYKIKLSNFVILLSKDERIEEDELSERKYSSPFERKFYVVDRDTLKNRENAIREGCKDIEIDISGLSTDSIVGEIEKEIKHYYMID